MNFETVCVCIVLGVVGAGIGSLIGIGLAELFLRITGQK